MPRLRSSKSEQSQARQGTAAGRLARRSREAFASEVLAQLAMTPSGRRRLVKARQRVA